MGSAERNEPYVLRPEQRRYLIIKRGLDILFSLLLLPVLAVPILLVAVIQKLAEPSEPVFFRHQRVGKDGVPFTLW